MKYDFLNDKEGACNDYSISKSLGFQLAFENSKGKCEEPNGVIKTKNGVLIYFNIENNYHTINLEGDIDLSNFPFIRQNNVWFQFITNEKSDFLKNGDNVLTNYMNWEIDYFEKQFNRKIKYKSSFVKNNDLIINYWNYDMPNLENENLERRVTKIFFADFIHNSLIYRFSYASESGNEAEANKILNKLVDNLIFYNRKIELNRLQNSIINGVNYYSEK